MYRFQQLKDRLTRRFGQGRFKNARLRQAILGGLFLALLTLILVEEVTPQRLDVRVGEVAPRDVTAPHDMVNRVATQQKKEMAANAIPVIQKVDLEILSHAEEYIDFAFREAESLRDQVGQDTKSKGAALVTRLGMATLSGDAAEAAVTADVPTMNTAKGDAVNLVRQILSGRVQEADVEPLAARVDQETGGWTLKTRSPALKTFVKSLVKSRIRPNLVDDKDATEQLRKAAAAAEAEVIWKKDRYIIKKGELVSEEQYAMLEDLRLVGPKADFRSLFGTGLLAAVMVALIGLYLYRYRPDILGRYSQTVMLGVIGIATLMLSLLMKVFMDSLGAGVGYLMPVAVNAILVSILLDPKVALLQSTVLAVVVGMSTQVDQLFHVLVALVGSAFGVYAVPRVESRTDIYKAGLLVSLTNVVAVLGINLIKAYSFLEPAFWVDIGLAAANGIIVAIVVTGALPVFETLFGVLTPLKLLELSNPNHPLLKRLLVEAPGSYHHTILVANLCEAAAEAIGADQVLARVGAYYHDIGKTKRPYFFVENQFGGENPHDKLPPSLSALIITSHVKDGIELAREARLPQEIIDFIPEHHGTMLVSYFYHMASKNGQSEYVLEEDFRYDGPRPRSKETAILMLADGCEASVRAIRQREHLTVDGIEAQVKRIIDDRLRQRQLENCDMTLRELEIITKVFVKVLSGVHHARVEYPAEALQGNLPGESGSFLMPIGKPEKTQAAPTEGTATAEASAPAKGSEAAEAPAPAEGTAEAEASAPVEEVKKGADLDQQ